MNLEGPNFAKSPSTLSSYTQAGYVKGDWKGVVLGEYAKKFIEKNSFSNSLLEILSRWIRGYGLGGIVKKSKKAFRSKSSRGLGQPT